MITTSFRTNKGKTFSRRPQASPVVSANYYSDAFRLWNQSIYSYPLRSRREDRKLQGNWPPLGGNGTIELQKIKFERKITNVRTNSKTFRLHLFIYSYCAVFLHGFEEKILKTQENDYFRRLFGNSTHTSATSQHMLQIQSTPITISDIPSSQPRRLIPLPGQCRDVPTADGHRNGDWIPARVRLFATGGRP